MNYRLLVEIDKQWRELDLGDEKPSMNYVQNDIGEIKDRRSNYSHKLQLPLTDGNVIALGMIDRIESAANVADRLLPCRLYCDEYEIVGTDGLMQIISVSNDCITVQVISGIADLFEKLKNSKMSDIDLGIFKSEDSYFLPQNFTDFCMVGLANFQSKWVSYYPTVGNTLPFARFLNVIDKVLVNHGYSLDTNIRNEIKDVVLPVVVPPDKPEGEEYIKYFSMRAENAAKSIEKEKWKDGENGYRWKITQNYTGELQTFSMAEQERFSLMWKPKNSGTAKIKFEMIDCLLGGAPQGTFQPTRATITKNGVLIADVTFSKTKYRGIIYDNNIDFSSGDVFLFTAVNLGYPIYGGLDYKLDIDILKKPYHIFNYLPEVNIASSLGFDTQLSVFKAFINTFGLYVDIDNKKKVVKAHTFQKVLDYKARQIDWTSKVDMREFECEFHNHNFAEHNHIRFEDNTKDEVTDIDTIDINDKTLQYEKDFMKLPFEAGKDKVLIYGFSEFATVPIIIFKDNVGEVDKLTSTKPHLCVLRDAVRYDFGIGKLTYNIVKHYKSSYIKRYYEPLFKTFKSYRKVTVKMLLEPPDLEVMQERIPVYLQQFGGYFYINSVRNYVCDELAEVEMIRV